MKKTINLLTLLMALLAWPDVLQADNIPVSDLTLRSNVGGWNPGVVYESFSDTGIYSWTITSEAIAEAGISANGRIEFKLFSGSTWYGNGGQEASEDWQDFTATGGNAYIVYNPEYTSYSIQAMYRNNKWQVRVVENIDNHDYYWVSPQVTNGQKLESCKFTALRNRSRDGDGKLGDGKPSNRYFTYTIKNDDVRKFNGQRMAQGEKVEWYIVRDDDQMCYRPEAGEVTNPAATGDNGGGVKYKNFENYRQSGNAATGFFAFDKGFEDAKSYTFVLNAVKGHISLNYATQSADTSKKYCLIGNFTSAKGDVDISFSDGREMKKLWYKDGVEYETDIAQADSIIYTVDVQKPAEGWGDLYLLINPEGNTGWSSYGTAGAVIRPVVSIQNNVDGRALMGGLMTKNYDQSLNPEPDDSYAGYTLRFNATTMTYRLAFHKALYLVGPAVSAKEGTLGSWDISNTDASDPRIPLGITSEADHYCNRVYFTQGQDFLFLSNEETNTVKDYRTTWREDGNVPLWVSATDESQYSAGQDTQYNNTLTYLNDGSASNTDPGTGAIRFDLPTGWYTIHFYNGEGTPYYTIERDIELRDFANVHYQKGTIDEDRIIQGRGDYNFFRVWSDHIAWQKPDDVDVYVVSTLNAAQGSGQSATVTLQKLDTSYIPAHTGVILASSVKRDDIVHGTYQEAPSPTAYNTWSISLTPYGTPLTDYAGQSRLTPLYEAVNLQRYVDEGGDRYANYLFGFYRKSKVDPTETDPTTFLLGFWMTTGIGNTYPNSAFLRLTTDESAAMGVGSSYDYDTASGSAPCFLLLFSDDEETTPQPGQDHVTAIRDHVQAQSDRHAAPWHTLQGQPVAKPTAPGIYLRRGQKVIIK